MTQLYVPRDDVAEAPLPSAVRADDLRVHDAPAIRALDEAHEAAVAAHASDVHIEPDAGGGRIRQRVDGVLRASRGLDAELFAQLVSRVKLLAGMDIADRRQPQDGRYSIETAGRSIDVRVSSMPTMAGEKLVLRLLDLQSRVPTLETLGMEDEMLDRYRSFLHAPHGFIIVCGPTGSGKTTTLYASMSERNVESEHVCSVEDPVEVRLPGVAQVQIHERAGLTFARALRAFLRQDPNVVLIGEMRDEETAGVAVSAALSGQLVLTTLHASDAIRAVDRLVELGLKRAAIASAVTAIVAQRLIRVLCVDCRQWAPVTGADARVLGVRDDRFVFAAKGCARCGMTGYRGRTAIFELLPLDPEMRELIARGEVAHYVRAQARSAGYAPLIDLGIARVLDGTTTVSELRRVLNLGEAL